MIWVFVVLSVGGFSKSQKKIDIKILILLSNKIKHFITLLNICHKLYYIILLLMFI